MSYSFGNSYKLTVFGQSHAEEIGIIIDGLKAGYKINIDLIKEEMKRRRPGKNSISSKRNEDDEFSIVAGLVDGYTCEAPLAFKIVNKDTRSRDYSEFTRKPRPSHADYPSFIKYQAFNDIRGGGAFSGRMTAPIVIAGAIAKDILSSYGIEVTSHISSIGQIEDEKIDPANPDREKLLAVRLKDFPTLSENKGKEMKALIEETASQSDSIGGAVELIVLGLPVGLGQPIYDSVESVIAKNIFSVPAVRGIEFGLGFEASKLKGSKHNDPYYYQNGQVKTKTNNHGGVIGGITSSMPLVFRIAVKATSSIGLVQETVDLDTKENTLLQVSGRHDPCIVHRALVVHEAMTAISILDLMMMGGFYELR